MAKDGKAKSTKTGEPLPTACERRILSTDDMELRVDEGDDPQISGYAAKYGKWSTDLGGFFEKIRAGAFDEALADADSDVRALKNHDPNLLLGRTASKTLRLESNSVGLKFNLDVPKTTTGRDTVEEIRRKDITGCSFSFTTAEDDWKYLEDGSVQRTIIKVAKLFDVGPVTYPAYPDTSVAVRSLDAFKASTEPPAPDRGQEDQANEPAGDEHQEQTQTIDRERERDIAKKYRKAGRIIHRCRSADD